MRIEQITDPAEIAKARDEYEALPKFKVDWGRPVAAVPHPNGRGGLLVTFDGPGITFARGSGDD